MTVSTLADSPLYPRIERSYTLARYPTLLTKRVDSPKFAASAFAPSRRRDLSSVSHPSCIRVTRPYMYHASFICVPCLIRACDILRESIRVYSWVDTAASKTLLVPHLTCQCISHEAAASAFRHQAGPVYSHVAESLHLLQV